MKVTVKEETHFWQGNQACAEAAIVAGCRFFAGYPITPASEIIEHLSKSLPQVGGVSIQMEDELAAIGAVIGASWTGTKAMTATSGPGFSLMQESIGYAFMTETPLVLVNVQRTGPSTGQATKCGQGDVMQSRWGTHGDYSAIVLSPNSVQEMFEFTIWAFNLSEQYRTPVLLLADETIAHMRERITLPLPNLLTIHNRKHPQKGETAFFGSETIPPMPSIGEGFNVSVTGSTHDESGLRFTADPLVHRRLIERLTHKIQINKEAIVEVETYKTKKCQIGLVSFGCTSRSVYDAIYAAENEGISVGYVRMKTLWPFPKQAVQQLAESANTIIVPELNLGQIVMEVERVSKGSAKVVSLTKIGGGELITPLEILGKIREVSKT